MLPEIKVKSRNCIIKVVSRNCANNTINPSLYGGCVDNTSICNGDILFHQEVPKQTFSKFLNPKFSVEEDRYMSYLKIDGRMCGVMAQNVGMSSTSKGERRFPKAENHCTVLVWNDSQFNFLWKENPSYMDTSLINGSTEIGIRSTPWIAVEHIETKKVFILISVHAHAGNPTKRSKLLTSIFQDAEMYEGLNLCPIIAGDFNEKPEILNGYLQTNLRSSWKIGAIDVTHINNENNFMGYIDYIFSSRELLSNDVVISGIDQNTGSMSPTMSPTMSTKMQQSQNDHAVISQLFFV